MAIFSGKLRRAAQCTGLGLAAVSVVLLRPASSREAPSPVVRATSAPILTIPAPPQTPQSLSFSDEVSGRHLLYDARTAYRSAAGVSFDAHWVSVGGGIAEPVEVNRSGDIRFSIAAPDKRLRVSAETDGQNGEREIRQAASDGTELVTTHFHQTSAAPADIRRTTARLTIDDDETLPRELAKIQLNPQVRAASFCLEPRAYVAGSDAVIWHAGSFTLPRVGRLEVVDQVESADPNRAAEERKARQRVYRYAIEADTHRLYRMELWEVDYTRARPARTARRRSPDGKTISVSIPASIASVNYRREDYSNVSVSASQPPSGPWVLNVPKNYETAPLPEVNLPEKQPLLPPDRYDPRALKMLDRWRAAHDRLLALSTDIEVTQRDVPRTSDARPMMRRQQNIDERYQVTFRRPAKLHLLIKSAAEAPDTTEGYGRGRFRMRNQQTPLVNGTVISDGEVVTLETAEGHLSQNLRGPDSLYQAVNQLARGIDQFDALGVVLNEPPGIDRYDHVTYDGPTMLDDQIPVESVTLHQYAASGNGQSESLRTVQILLGSDGLPRLIITRTTTNLNGRMERDQPAIRTILMRYVNLATDREPPSALFVLPRGE